MSAKIRRITESAMLLAVAIVLELISKTFIPEQPFGGQITIVSMLPIVLVSYRHGIKWGFLTAAAYAFMEMVIGMRTISAAFLPGSDEYMGMKALLMVGLDYLAAFTALGLGGIFRSRIQKPGLSLCLGSLVALGARYLCHLLSGYILYASWAEYFFTQEGFPAWGQRLVEAVSPETLSWIYSAVYNGMFMLPEMLFTALAALLLARVPGIVRKISD